MKKLLFTAAALVASVVSFNASAQLADTETLNASAKVLKQIQLANRANVLFGAVASTTLPYLSPLTTAPSDAVPGLLTGRANLGRMEIDATFQEVLSLSYASSVVLTNIDVPSATIRYVPQVSVQNGIGGAAPTTDARLVGSVSTIAPADITNTTAANNGMGGASLNYVQIQRSGTAPSFTELTTLYFGGWLVAPGATIVQGTAPTSTDQLPGTLTSGTYSGTVSLTVDYVL